MRKIPSKQLEKSYEIYQEELEALNDKDIASAIVHHIFRNGPVEGMHAEGKLTEEDMRILNKYAMDKMFEIIVLYRTGSWASLLAFFGTYSSFGNSWDDPEPDIESLTSVQAIQSGMSMFAMSYPDRAEILNKKINEIFSKIDRK